jgi:hypothetical protein
MSQNLIQTNDPGFSRDPSTHAILNTNSEAWRAFKERRAAAQHTASLEQRVANLENNINQVQTALSTIIDLLQKK